MEILINSSLFRVVLGEVQILPLYVFWLGLSQIWELFCFALVLIGNIW